MFLNRQRALELMQHCQLDAIIASSPVNVTYFTGYHCWLDSLMKEYMVRPGASDQLLLSFAVFTRDGRIILVVRSVFAVNTIELSVDRIETFGGEFRDSAASGYNLPSEFKSLDKVLRKSSNFPNAVDALANTLKKEGLQNGCLGLDTELLSENRKRVIVEKVPKAQFKGCNNLIRLVRMVKSQTELEHLSKAAEINEIAGFESFAQLNTACSLQEANKFFRKRLGELGADFDHYTFGLKGMGIANEPGYILQPGDVLYADFGCTWGHYFSDTGCTLAVGQPSQSLTEKYEGLRDALESGAEMLRPGTNSSSVQAAMMEAIKERIGSTNASPEGHGLGLEVRDYPIIVPDTGLRIQDECVDEPANLPLEQNMVINLEGSFFISAVGSLNIEKTFVITENASRPLVRQNRTSPFVICA
jgi:Xaa-Pro dipeptidase